jgi:Domain of unknown function (DUF4160)
MARIDIPVEGNLLETLSESFYSVEVTDNDEVNKLVDEIARLISRTDADIGSPAGEIGTPTHLVPEAGNYRSSPRIVARVFGLTIEIWADEHPPPHFHVAYQGEDASFSIVECTRLPGSVGLQRYERKIRDWWKQNQSLLIEKWNSSRPANCPVGPINQST